MRVVQNAKTLEEMWYKFNTLYEETSTSIKVSLLASVINSRYQAVNDLGDYIAELETNFIWQTIMPWSVGEETQSRNASLICKL